VQPLRTNGPHTAEKLFCGLLGCDSLQSPGWLSRVSKELSSSIFRVPCLGLCKVSRLPFAGFVCFVALLLAVGEFSLSEDTFTHLVELLYHFEGS
jgi:hypothetical protein